MIRSLDAIRPSARRRRLRAVSALAAAAALLAALPGHAQEAVGQVSLLIGQARVVHRDGSTSELRSGARVLVGDRIETAANGHVHVRFVDNAAISVRPESVLEVQAYRYDAARPEASEIRLKVAQGIGRSISGAAADADRSRFRLNTPIAAIGVRGTDFIVQALPDQVRATVATGAIVMSPLGNGCSAEGVGPCGGRVASVLSADMGRLMIEMRPGDRTPRVVPAVEGLLATATPSVDARNAAYAAALAAAHPSAESRGIGGDASAASNERAAAQLLAIAPIGPVDARELNSPPDRNAQLAWGRWFSRDELDNVSLSYALASAGRHVTVGDSYAGLFRGGSADDASSAFDNPSLGRVDFRLSRAQASFDIGSRTEAASVDGGTLSLDFTNRSFATALALSSPTAGKAELRMGGVIRPDGMFAAADADQRIAGAISLDLKEAGYLFSRRAGGGTFRGRTLWGR